MKTIVAAAIQVQSLDGVVNFVMLPPHRHHHILHEINKFLERPHGGVQGFIDSGEEFHTRESAAEVAIKAGQVVPGQANIKHVFDGFRLYSEDLW